MSGRGRAALLLSLAVVFWGTQFRATAIGEEAAPALVFATLRVLPAAVALAIWAWLRHERPFRPRILLLAAANGLGMVTLDVIGLTEGIAHAGSGNTAVIVNTAPFFIVLFDRVLFGVRVSSTMLAGLVTGFGGVILMVSSQLGGSGGASFADGIAFALLSAVTWAGGTLLVKWLANRDSAFDIAAFTATMFAIGGLALLAVALIADGTASTEWGSGRLWAATAWVSLGAGAVGTVAYFTALRLISSARASAWLFLVPAVAVLVELARGNVPNATTLAGMALAIGGVALVNMPATRFAPLDSSRPRDS